MASKAAAVSPPFFACKALAFSCYLMHFFIFSFSMWPARRSHQEPGYISQAALDWRPWPFDQWKCQFFPQLGPLVQPEVKELGLPLVLEHIKESRTNRPGF